MNVRQILYFVLLLTLVAACSNNTNKYTGFPETVTVVTRQLGLDSVAMQYPYRVKRLDSSLYITDLHTHSFYCNAFTYPPLKHQVSFARRGKAPGELTVAINIIVHPNGTVYLLDSFARKIYAYDGKQINFLMELPEELLRCSDFTLYNDSVFIVTDYSGQSRVAFVDFHGKIIRRMGSIPAKERPAGSVPVAALVQAWRPFIHYNPNNGILALATQLGEVLEIYDVKNDSTLAIVGPAGEPRYRLDGERAVANGIMGFGDVYVGDKYIYAIFWGHEFEKIKEGKTEQGGDLVYVFDLKGKPVRKYKLDCYITGFDIDETTGEVVGTDVSNEQLVVFNL